jgi:hypothetical protein
MEEEIGVQVEEVVVLVDLEHQLKQLVVEQ